MGNFMLVADWTRTGYAVLEDGSRALEYNHIHFTAFDIFMAKRHETAQGDLALEEYIKDGSYTSKEVDDAKKFWEETLKSSRQKQETLAI